MAYKIAKRFSSRHSRSSSTTAVNNNRTSSSTTTEKKTKKTRSDSWFSKKKKKKKSPKSATISNSNNNNERRHQAQQQQQVQQQQQQQQQQRWRPWQHRTTRTTKITTDDAPDRSFDLAQYSANANNQYNNTPPSSNNIIRPFDLAQYSDNATNQYCASFYGKNSKKAVMKQLSKRIRTRVETDSSDLIEFYEKRINNKRRRQQQQQQGQPSIIVAPECVLGSDLILGKCLGQGSFSSVFVLDKYINKSNNSSNNNNSNNNTKINMKEGPSKPNNSNSPPSLLSAPCRGRRSIRRREGNEGASSTDDDDNINEQRTRTTTTTRTSRSLSSRRRSNEGSTDISDRSRSSNVNSSSRSRSLNLRRRSSSSGSSSDRSQRQRQQRNRSLSSLRRRRGGSRRRRNNGSSSSSLNDDNINRDGSSSSSSSSSSFLFSSITDNDSNSNFCEDASNNSIPSNYTASSLMNDVNNCDTMVVKVLQPKLMVQRKGFAKCVAGLIREGLFLAALDGHPHILKLHAWTSPYGWKDFAALSAKEEGRLYDGYMLVLERLRGGTLTRWLRKWRNEEEEEHQEKEKAISAVVVVVVETAEAREQERRLRQQQQPSTSSSPSSSSPSSSAVASSSNNNNRFRKMFASATRKNKSKSKRKSKQRQGTTPTSTTTTTTTTADDNNFDKIGRDDGLNNDDDDDDGHPYPRRWPTTKLSDRIDLLTQLSDTVKYLHKHRILHRDLKPDNLGVTFDDSDNGNNDHNTNTNNNNGCSSLSLKVFDFDIARLVPKEESAMASTISNTSSYSSSTGTAFSSFSLSSEDYYNKEQPSSSEDNNELLLLFKMTGKMGSPRYMAPEIARGEAYNLCSEVYTVCLLIHEVLTLRKPYSELPPEHHGQSVHFDIPGYRPPIREVWNWPAELRQLLERGWGGDIRQRPSMNEVHSVLKRALPKLVLSLPAAPQSSTMSTAIATATSASSPLSPERLAPQRNNKTCRLVVHRNGNGKAASPILPVSPTVSEPSSSQATSSHPITDE